MRHVSEVAESKEITGRCRLINTCFNDKVLTPGDGITWVGKRAYVGIESRLNNVIQRSGVITRSELVKKVGICWVDIRDSVNRLISDGTISEDFKKNSHHIFRGQR